MLHVDLAPHAEREQAALTSLDAGELARLGRFEYEGARRRFVLCRAALRDALRGALGCANDELAFGAGEHGKPFALVRDEPAAISFSVSHGGRHGRIALAPRGRIGVDVEEREPRRTLDLLAEAALADEERAEFDSAPEAERPGFFFRLWTMKEAVLKAHGTGFRSDMTAFAIPRALRHGASSGTLELPDAPGAAWRIDDLGDARFAAALAREAGTEGAP